LAAFAMCVSDPTWAVPAIVHPGQSFALKAQSPVLSIKATKGDFSFNLLIEGKGNEVKVTVPRGAQPGLYDLIVKTKDGVCYQHNALWVLGKKLNRLVIMHLSDEHFGVYDPSGRTAFQYALAAVIIANSDPKVNAVVVTGDIADTAMPSQYEQARLVHGLLTKPVFIIPGNHDHVNAEDTYSEYVGPHNWYRSFDGFLIVGLDTGAEGYLSYQQASWASEILQRKASAKIVLFHHPLFAYVYGDTPHSFEANSWEDLYKILMSKKPGSKYTYLYGSWLADTEGLKTFLKAIYNDNVTLTLSGHIHLDSYATVSRPSGLTTWFITTTTAGGPVRRGDYHGFRIISIAPNEVNAYGLGKPWSRHASYSLEGALADLHENENVSVVTFELKDSHLLKLMPRLVLAVPIPKDFQGHYKVYAPGFQRTWVRCTPASCIFYASTSNVTLNKVYRLAVYMKPDLEAPKIYDIQAPKEVHVGNPFTISFEVSDDSWGVANVYAVIKGAGLNLKAIPTNYGGTYTISMPPLNKPGKLNVTLVAEDYYGHKTVKSFSIGVKENVVKQTTTTTTTEHMTTVTESKTNMSTITYMIMGIAIIGVILALITILT